MSAAGKVIVPVASEPDAKARAVRDFLASLHGRGDFPAFAENVHAVNATTRTSASSARRLADMVLRDVALTAKVLGVANSVSYNRTSDVIVDLSYAVLIMGFDRVRDLALAATLLDHFKRAPGVRELLGRAVLIANQNHALARYVGYRSVEEAYLAGMFANLGEVVAACYRVDDYAEVQRLQREGLTADEAAERVFGLTFGEISKAVGAKLKLPERILVSMNGVPAPDPERTVPAHRSQAELLALLTDLSGALVEASWRQNADKAEKALTQVWRERGRPLNLSEAELEEANRAALAETRDTFRLLKISLGDLLGRQAPPPAPKRPPAVQPAEPARAPTPIARPAPEPESPREVPPELASLIATIRELRRLEGSGRPQEVASLVLRSLEAICEAGYQRAVFALSDAADRSDIRGRLSFGEGALEVQRVFEIQVSSMGSPLGATLARKADAVFQIEQAGFLRQDRLLRQLAPKTFGILPLVVNKILIGCLYFDHSTAALETNGRLTSLLQDLRDTLVKQLRN